MVAAGLIDDAAFVALVCMAQLMAQAGLGQTLTAQGIVGESLGTTAPGQLSWMTAAYSMTVGTFILLAGRLGDVFGHRRLYFLGWIEFGLASLGAGLCSYNYASPIPFDVFRALQGLGPALLIPNGLALLGRRFHNREKAKPIAFALFGAVAPGGYVFGAVFASLTAQKGHWPWAYYATTILCSLLAVATLIVIPQDDVVVEKGSKEGKRGTWAEAAKQLDLLGSSIGVLGLLLFNFAWNQAPLVGWGTAQAITTLILGVALIATFLVYEKYVAAEPILPWSHFSFQSSFVLACVAGGWSSFGVFVYYSNQAMLIIDGSTPLTVAVRYLPAAFTGASAALITTVLLRKVKPSVVMLLATLAFLTGSILTASRPHHQTFWAQLFPAFLITPFGMDFSFPAATIILSNCMPIAQQGMAGSLVATFVNYSISFGLGIAGTVEVYTSRGDEARGIRAAQWTGVGLAGLAVCVSSVYLCIDYSTSSKRNQPNERAPQLEDPEDGIAR